LALFATPAASEDVHVFGRTRDRLDRLERFLESLAHKLDNLAAQPAAPPASNDAMAKLFGTIISSNVDLVGAMGDLAVRSVARRNGIKGGARNAQTAQRDGAGKFLPKRRIERAAAPRCKLCLYGESYPGVTVDMVKEHRTHLEARERREENAGESTDAPESGDEQHPIDPTTNGAAGPVH
jgi:hypothetical protein